MLLREKLEAVSAEVCKVSKSHKTEVAERQSFLLGLQQYGSQIERGINVFLQIAQEKNVRSDASLDDLANSLVEDNRVPFDMNPTEKDEAIQTDGSFIQPQSTERDVDNVHTVDGQPVAMQGNHLFQGLTPLALLND